MTIFEAIMLGIVQGLTEFLPVSSSGHLVILHEFFGTTGNDLTFDVLLHVASLLAVFVYFRNDIWTILKSVGKFIFGKSIERKEKNVLLALVFGIVPAGVAGLLFASEIEEVFRSSFSVAITLILGSILFVIAESMYKNGKELTGKRGFLIGCFQALALIPGVSRSGATISGGLMLGLSREEAIRFSFLLSIPVILGAGLLEVGDGEMIFWSAPILLGGAAAFISGLGAIHFLVRFLKTNTLMPFVWYRIILALVILVLF